MTAEPTIPLNHADEKARVAFRRLLLAKELYLHGFDHSNKAGALNKMIAVHNFHNAIEIALRAILLHYEIRANKELNIVFEVMLNEIDNHEPFRERDIKLPYRQQLRALNESRNLVQHHAVEPPTSTMEEWRVFTHRCLEQVFERYFKIDFNKVSPLDMIENETLRNALKGSLASLQENNLEKSVILSKTAFEWAAFTLLKFLPERQFSEVFSDTISLNQFGELQKVLEQLSEMSRGALYFAALMWSGTSPIEYKRYKSYTSRVSIHFSDDGTSEVVWMDEAPDKESVKWLNDFVAGTIIRWQALGFASSISQWHEEVLKSLLDD